jgi:hypothetical protein
MNIETGALAGSERRLRNRAPNYLQALQVDATNLDALIELGALGEADGYRQAPRRARPRFMPAQISPWLRMARSFCSKPTQP